MIAVHTVKQVEHGHIVRDLVGKIDAYGSSRPEGIGAEI